MKLSEINLVVESRGEEVMRFSDYVERAAANSLSIAAGIESIGVALFKEGYSYDDTLFHKLLDEGGVVELRFPAVARQMNDSIQCYYYVFRQGKKYEFNRSMSINEIQLWTVPTLLHFMKQAARKA